MIRDSATKKTVFGLVVRAADMTGITKKGNQDSIGITENTLGFRRDYEKK